jgi:mevalonate pyrophosphate decarboxylase
MRQSGAATTSVSFRMQRTTTETAVVSVPVTDDLMIRQPDGSGRLNVEKMMQRALDMARQSGVEWQAETQQVQMHPIQIAPPHGAKQKP